MVLRVVAFGVCRETIALLRYLLALAIKGNVRGIAICYWEQGKGNQVATTGLFSAEPERALGGADLIKVHAGRQLDLFAS